MQKIKDYIYFNRKEIITVFICFISFFSLSFFNSKEDSVIVSENIVKVEKEVEEVQFLMVDVKGEVLSPGTYQLDVGKRIIDAIEKSGGLTSDADVNLINLSEKLVDEMVIYIPSKNSDKEESNFNNIKKENNIDNKDSKISINTANETTLMTLNGIGEKKAKAIVSYREQNGPFKCIEDITKVSGIGSSLFDKIKDFIKV